MTRPTRASTGTPVRLRPSASEPSVDDGVLAVMDGVSLTGPARLGVEEWVHPVTGQWHCLEGPARVDEYQHSWFLLGQLHREGGPAVYDLDGGGDRRWYRRGVFHRLDGPAWEMNRPDARGDLWYVDGMRVTEEPDVEVLEELRAAGEVTMLELVLAHWGREGGSEPLEPFARAVRAAHM